MNLKVMVSILVLMVRAGFASTPDMTENYYNSLYLGEFKTKNYFGPTDPRSVFSDEKGTFVKLDDVFANEYLDDQIQQDVFKLHDFWFKKVSEKSTCPDSILGENIDYIQYLYRLLSISYLFEDIKLNNKTAHELGADKNVCSLSFEEIFNGCHPVTADMKKFHERVYGKFVNEYSKVNIPSLGKKETAAWMESFQKSTALTTDPVMSRLHDYCVGEKKSCRTLSLSEVKVALANICAGDRELIQKFCSEKDDLHGISYAEKATELIQSSNAFNLINRSGMGEECLRRYVKLFTPKEVKYSLLGRSFPLIYSRLTKMNSRYLQGDLFLPGALKEFDMKGLSDFLTALKPPKPVEKVAVIPKPKPKPKPKPVVVEKKVEVPKPEPVEIVIPEPPKPKVSEFEAKLVEMDEKKLSSLSLNMDNFRDDFEFTSSMIAELTAPIKKFQTRAALIDMKAYDNLGAKEAPVGLIFLKYLIDTENHQGLYNIVTVLGDKFYVNNDLEGKTKPVFIELKNDASTKNRWQIILLKK